MRFSRILHPEIMLNRRGEKRAREIYQKALDMIEITDNGVYFQAKDELSWVIAQSLQRDHVFLRFMTNCKIFKSKKSQVYHIGKDFLVALQKIDREIPLDVLPSSFSAYISFAEDTVFDEEGSVEGGYVSIGTGKNLGLKTEFENTLLISFSYICKVKNDDGMPPCVSLTVPLDAKRIDDLVSQVEPEDFFFTKVKPPANASKRNDVFKALLNAVIYLHSTEPFIEISRPIKQSGFSVNEHRRRGLIINDCTLPVSFLYPKYVQVKSYKVDSTWVDSHPRWQRCGANLAQVKLVFVTPHERRYKREDCNFDHQR
jgi:hypothetical protein